MEAVNSLGADGGGDDPEMFWSGLLMAISNAPMFSDIICFTDAVGKDGELVASVKALANEKHSKVGNSYVCHSIFDTGDHNIFWSLD